MLTTIKRIFNLAWSNVSRNFGLSLVAVFVITITVLLITSIYAIKDFSELLVEDVKDRISVGVYFKDGVEEDVIFEIKDSVLGLEETRGVEYTSKLEAFDIFVERYENDPVLMASLIEVGNPFLASLNIKSNTIEGYQVIVNHLENSPLSIFIEDIDYDQRKEVINNIFEITVIAQQIALILAIITAIIAILIVFNTVRLAIYGMKEEIKMMRLVGVSNKFIKALFVMQGAIIGALSFISAFIFVFISALLFSERLRLLIPSLDLFNYLKENFLIIVLVQILVGLGLGIISSVTATIRYLKD